MIWLLVQYDVLLKCLLQCGFLGFKCVHLQGRCGARRCPQRHIQPQRPRCQRHAPSATIIRALLLLLLFLLPPLPFPFQVVVVCTQRSAGGWRTTKERRKPVLAQKRRRFLAGRTAGRWAGVVLLAVAGRVQGRWIYVYITHTPQQCSAACIRGLLCCFVHTIVLELQRDCTYFHKRVSMCKKLNPPLLRHSTFSFLFFSLQLTHYS